MGSPDSQLARFCKLAYLPDPTAIVGNDLAANVVELDDEVVVAFRGTANPRGWVRNFDVLPKSHPLVGYCHHGFLTAASALTQRIVLPAGKRVTITGHSLGGAIAVIFGALRIAVGERCDGLVTFGAPRAGYSRLAAIWAPVADVRQYRCGNDPVTEVPLALLAFPYAHVRTPIEIGEPDPEKAWRCHDIRRYEMLVPDGNSKGDQHA